MKALCCRAEGSKAFDCDGDLALVYDETRSRGMGRVVRLTRTVAPRSWCDESKSSWICGDNQLNVLDVHHFCSENWDRRVQHEAMGHV